MNRRTRARELALKALYQFDLCGCDPLQGLHELSRSHGPADVLAFAEELVQGCVEHQQELDEMIEQTAENWEIRRMPIIDRNILRLGACELVYREDTPPKVAINEAIELAKKYSTENSPTFVNGLLDRIYFTHRKEKDRGPVPTGQQRETEENRSDDADRIDPEARADLHIHSTVSDGSVEPQDIARLAAQAGLRAFALTDHDSTDGVEAARKAAQAAGIEFIAGVELSGYAPTQDGQGDVEVHILGLFVDPADPALVSELKRLRKIRVGRIKRISEKLKRIGLAIEDKQVLDRALGGSVGRLHVAQEMIEQGVCKTIREAFEKYLGPLGPAYVPKGKMTPQQAMRLVRGAGGCAVFAHPGHIEEAPRLIEELAGEGLAGIEVHYPLHTDQQERDFLDMARRLGLAGSGGSDFHGAAKPDRHVGQESVSFVELERLRKAARLPP